MVLWYVVLILCDMQKGVGHVGNGVVAGNKKVGHLENA